MAEGGQLTWRNVDAPNFSGGNDAFRTAALLLSKASTPVQEALTSFQNEERLRQSALAQTNVLTSANPMTALQSGTALAGIDPGMLSQEAINNMGMEAQRRAQVGNTLASTANTQANTDRTTQLTPGMVTQQGLEIDFNRQANPIKISSAQTSADAAKLSLQEASELNTINDNARKIYQEYSQNGSLTTAEGRDNAIRSLEARGLDPRIITGFKSMVSGASAPVTGNADALILGQPPLSGAPTVTVANPFDNNQGSAIKAYMPKMFGAEGGSKNGGMVPNAAGASSAFGPAQFTDGTWIDTVRENDPATFMRLGGNRNAILGLRTDQNYHRTMAEKFTEGNAKLIPEGVPVNDGSLYAMHFFGRGAGPKVLAADASTPISQLVGADAIRANPFLKGMTAGEARSWAANAISKKGGVGPTVANAQAMEAAGRTNPGITQGPAPQAYNPITTAPSNDPIQLLQQTKDLNNQAQALLDQNRVRSNLYDTDASIAKALVAPNEGKSRDVIIDELVKKGVEAKGPDSIFADNARNRIGITNAINRLQDKFGIAPNAAAAFIADSVTTTNKFFMPDYQSIDETKLDALASRFYDKDSKQPKQEMLNKGIALVNGDKQDQIIQQRVELYNNVSAVQRNELANLIESRKVNSGAGLEAAIDRKKSELAQTIKSIQADLKKIRASSDMSDKARQRQ